MKHGDDYLIAEVFDGRILTNCNFSQLLVYGDIAKGLVSAFEDYFNRYQSGGGFAIVRTVINQMGSFGAGKSIDLGSKEIFQEFLYEFRAYWYTTDTSKAHLFTRNEYWMSFIGYLRFCMDEKVVPRVVVPPGNPKLNNRSVKKKSDLEELKLKGDGVVNAGFIPMDIHRKDEDYLNELHKRFATAKSDFLNASLKEIYTIKEYFDLAGSYSEQAKWVDLRTKLQDSAKEGFRGRDRSITGSPAYLQPHHPNYVKNVLCYINNKHNGLYLGPKKCGLMLEEDSLLKSSFRTHPSSIPATVVDMHLGRMTPRMMVPFFVYFLIMFPRACSH